MLGIPGRSAKKKKKSKGTELKVCGSSDLLNSMGRTEETGKASQAAGEVRKDRSEGSSAKGAHRRKECLQWIRLI